MDKLNLISVDEDPSRSSINRWHHEFNCGRSSLQVKVHEGCSKSVVVPRNQWCCVWKIWPIVRLGQPYALTKPAYFHYCMNIRHKFTLEETIRNSIFLVSWRLKNFAKFFSDTTTFQTHIFNRLWICSSWLLWLYILTVRIRFIEK